MHFDQQKVNDIIQSMRFDQQKVNDINQSMHFDPHGINAIKSVKALQSAYDRYNKITSPT